MDSKFLGVLIWFVFLGGGAKVCAEDLKIDREYRSLTSNELTGRFRLNQSVQISEDLYAGFYGVPPTFLNVPDQGEDIKDPFADVETKEDVTISSPQEVLEAAGITFPPGSSIQYFPQLSILKIVNTKENLDLFEAYGCFMSTGVVDNIVSYLELYLVSDAVYQKIMRSSQNEADVTPEREALTKSVNDGDAEKVFSAELNVSSGNLAELKTDGISVKCSPVFHDDHFDLGIAVKYGETVFDVFTKTTDSVWQIAGSSKTKKGTWLLLLASCGLEIRGEPEVHRYEKVGRDLVRALYQIPKGYKFPTESGAFSDWIKELDISDSKDAKIEFDQNNRILEIVHNPQAVSKIEVLLMRPCKIFSALYNCEYFEGAEQKLGGSVRVADFVKKTKIGSYLEFDFIADSFQDKGASLLEFNHDGLEVKSNILLEAGVPQIVAKWKKGGEEERQLRVRADVNRISSIQRMVEVE